MSRPIVVAGMALALLGVACASKAPPRSPPPQLPPQAATSPAVDDGAARQAAEAERQRREAEAKVRAEQDGRAMKVALELGLGTFDVKWSPTRRLFALLPKSGDQFRLVVHADDGQRLSEFALTGPGSDLVWLGDARVAVRIDPPPPTGKGKARARGARAKAAQAAAPYMLLQPVRPGAVGIRLDGDRFVVSAHGEHIAHVAHDKLGHFVAVDGVAVYPRQGRTGIQSALAFSDDGRALAFIEKPRTGAARLVLLADHDNATGDTTWPLPPGADDPSHGVFWAGNGRLLVGPSATKPVFSTTFETVRPAP